MIRNHGNLHAWHEKPKETNNKKGASKKRRKKEERWAVGPDVIRGDYKAHYHFPVHPLIVSAINP